MPRSVQITILPDHTDALVAEIKKLDGLIGLRVERGISVLPPGDVVMADVSTPALHELMRVLEKQGVGREANCSAQTNQPQSMVNAAHTQRIADDSSEATWEEIDLTIGHESNMTVNGLWLMACAGAISAISIHTDALHLAIGAAVIAPGFEPIARISLGIVAGGTSWRRGVFDTIVGYLALCAGAVLVSLILRAIGMSVLDGKSPYLADRTLLSYWTTVNATGLLVTAIASMAGAVLLVSNRSVLTAGVMIALALVPTVTIAAMGVVAGDFELAGRGLLRWSIEVVAVGVISALVFTWKRARIHQRSFMG